MTGNALMRWAAAPLTVVVLLCAGCVSDTGAGETAAPIPMDAAATASASPMPSSDPPTSAATTRLPLRVAVVGDSNTTGFKTTLEDGIDAGVSWIAMVPQAEIKYAGGWARNGATSTAMREGAAPIPDTDVLVIMAGTNNLAFGVAQEVLDDDLRAISMTVGAAHTVVSAIAPFDARPDEAIALNAHLAALAAVEGWTYVDPWTNLRDAEGKWVDWYRVDGLHTGQEGYQAMADAMRVALLDRFGPESDQAQ